MARYDLPVPALFATIHRYPEGEVERMNRALADDYDERALIHDTALQVLRNALPWAAKRAEQLHHGQRQRWRPREVAEGFPPWAARLQAFQWGGRGGAVAEAAETSAMFNGFADGLSDEDSAARVEAAGEIFRWGRAGPASWTVEQVDLVIAAARTGVVAKGTPWSSGWTKVAAAATHPKDLDPDAAGHPQVIWDSRVSFAVAELLPEATDPLLDRLSVVAGKTKRRTGDSPRAQRLKSAGWRFNAAPSRAWTTQLWGSRLVHAMSGILNSSDEFETERLRHRHWTAFDVAAALFVEGY